MRSSSLPPRFLLTLLLLSLVACGASEPDPVPVLAADLSCQQSTGTNTVVVGSGVAGDPSLPEQSSGYKLGKRPVVGRDYMVVTANPLATAAGCEVLKAGGTAIDAAVAAQAVLGLVEPQSSGLGGGGFLMHYRASTKELVAYDGRETAPAAANENYLRYIDGAVSTVAPLPNIRASGRSIGTPGVVRMLEMAHKDHGTTTWAKLFDAGIRHASDGFKISGRMADAIVSNRAGLLNDADAAAYFYNADQTPKVLGTLLKNPEYAETLRAIAAGGANAFYTGPIAQSIVDKIKVTTSAATPSIAITPGLTDLRDLANYQAKKRIPVCINYRGFEVCGMPPPSSGGIAVAQTLGILENFDMAANGPTTRDENGGKPSILGVHWVSEAQRLAYADRNLYVADTDFVPLPGAGVSSMVNKTYLKQRAGLISSTRSMGSAAAGSFGASTAMGVHAGDGNGTTHLTIIDKQGNVVSFTTTVESSMGSFHMTRGFLLNNQLTDFSPVPSDATGLIANRVGPLKRPRSSMAPTVVFKTNADGTRGDVAMATGSPGGAAIIQFVAKTVVGVVDWGLDAQQATSMINFGAANSPTTGLGGEHPNLVLANNATGDSLVTGLRNLGHTVSTAAQSSGVSTIVRGQVNGKPAWIGGADPRREGIALGDGVTP